MSSPQHTRNPEELKTVIRRIVLGVDGTVGAARATAWAARLASRTGASVIAVHSLLAIDDYVAPGVERRGKRRAARNLNGPWTAELRNLAVATRTIVIPDNPAMALVRLGRTLHADLIVLGRNGHARWMPPHLGLVTHRVLRDAACPVAIIPPTTRDRAQDEGHAVVVGVDGSPGAASALRFAASLAETMGLELRTVHAVENRPIAHSSLQNLTAVVMPETVDSTEPVMTVERSPRVWQPTVTVAGKTEDVLIRAAAEAEVLVLGSKRRQPVGELFHGSTSHYCAARASCPVILIPTSRTKSLDRAGPE